MDSNNSSFDSSDGSSFLSDILESESESTIEELRKETEELERKFSSVVPVLVTEGKENLYADRVVKMSSDDEHDSDMVIMEEKGEAKHTKDDGGIEEQISASTLKERFENKAIESKNRVMTSSNRLQGLSNQNFSWLLYLAS